LQRRLVARRVLEGPPVRRAFAERVAVAEAVPAVPDGVAQHELGDGLARHARVIIRRGDGVTNTPGVVRICRIVEAVGAGPQLLVLVDVAGRERGVERLR
jgi:hypothetical protein